MTPSSSTGGYRPEIQGLRAIAALLVASYHIWFGRVSGGVDVFIVISAFLVTTTLLKQVDASQRVQFGTFWGGLVKRLVPASYCVLIAVAFAWILLMPRHEWIDRIGDIAASATYVENWLLAFRSTDYLAQGARRSPLQHYWALSVQGQLYILWPFLVAACVWLASRARARVRTVTTIGFAAVFAVSLAYSIVSTRANQPFAYFNTAARAWEFALGALFALWGSSLQLSRSQRIVAGWVGLLAILSCGVVFQVSRVFPGYIALWPTLSALLILAAGNSGSRFGADRLLSTPLLTWIGNRSYGLYLWHWPVYIIARRLTGQQAFGAVDGLAVIALSIGLAALTTTFIETPSRRGKTRLARPITVGLAWATPLLVLVVSWAAYTARARRVEGRVLDLRDPNYPGAAVMDTKAWYATRPGVALHPGPLAVKADRPSALQPGCLQNLQASEPLRCVFGDTSSPRVIAIVGSSRAAHWLPALERFAADEDWKIVTYTKNRCPFTNDDIAVFAQPYASCEKWNENVMRELLHNRPSVVFTPATRGSGPAERVPPGRVTQWRRLAAAGINVIAIRNSPTFPFDVPECVVANGTESKACVLMRSAALAASSPMSELQGSLPLVHFVDLSDYFCDDTACPPVIGNILVYSDASHMTAHYARTLGPVLERELMKIPSAHAEAVIDIERKP
ncbi:MAG: acyltransferase family protein [Gemmatimonadaceae bacterium]